MTFASRRKKEGKQERKEEGRKRRREGEGKEEGGREEGNYKTKWKDLKRILLCILVKNT